MEMYDNFKIRKMHPKDKANLISNILFTWQIPFFIKYLQNDSTAEEIYKPTKETKSKKLGDKLEEIWNNEIKTSHQNASLWRVLSELCGREMVFYIAFYLVIDIITNLGLAFSVGKILELLTMQKLGKEYVNKHEIYLWAALLITINLIRIFACNFSSLGFSTIGLQMKIACTSVLYRKSLEMDRSGVENSTIGHIMNMISNDLYRFVGFPFLVQFLWTAPITLIVNGYFLYFWIGLPSVSGIAILLPLISIPYLLGGKVYRHRSKIANITDKRIRLVNELIDAIKFIKMYTWEKPFSKIVATSRRSELSELRIMSHLKMFYTGIKMYSNRLALSLYTLTQLLIGLELNTKHIFQAATFYDGIRLGTIIYLPAGILALAETKVTVSRIQKFLLQECFLKNRRDSSKIITNYNQINNDSVGIIRSILCTQSNLGIFARNISTKWNISSKIYSLHDVNFLHNTQNLAAVVGASGSGKTTLLHVFLKEIPLLKGDLEIVGNVSYASQEPWIFSGTIQQNILFGFEMKPERYKEVLRVCALEQDLCMWSDGDCTLVGDRGVLLSGGQKARINLARAVYKEADIYLLDDPLSAVDVQVGKHLFNECIIGFLQKKCTVLVTHQLQFLKKVNNVYLMKDGKIAANGSFNNIQKIESNQFSGLDYYRNDKYESETERQTFLNKEQNVRKNLKNEIIDSFNSKENYLNYIRSAGGWNITVWFLVCFLLVQVSGNFTDYFVTFWLNYQETTSNKNNNIFLYINVALVLLIIILTFIRSNVNVKFCINASRTLHDDMFHKIVKSKLRFFHINPTGTILNRFSKDIGAIDENTIVSMMDGFQVLLNTFAITIITCILNYWAILPTFFLYLIYYGFIKIFFSMSKKVGNVESSMRSPVYTHFATSLRGLSIIRAQGIQSKLKDEFDSLQDDHSSVHYLLLALQSSFSFWVDFNTVVYQAIIILGIISFGSDQPVANVGLVLTQFIIFSLIISYGILNLNILDNCMISTGRIIEYSQIQPEEDLGKNYLEHNWPTEGNIKFQSVSMRYAVDDSLVIKNVTLEIKPREKIGIIGRTGAGKSSLISIIFRLCEFEGKVLIDNIDTKSISLNNLRSRISIIPQDPVLFSGTIRNNLDPFSDYNDLSLWKALENVQLKSFVSFLPLGLESVINKDGANFSVGQRQLLCLARVILRNNKILILDEATSNIDLLTDNLIQQTIRKKFNNCTVITIAHRLSTIMNSDKILVMENGRVVEFDHPLKLLQNSQGLFYRFVHQNRKTKRLNESE